MEWIENTMYVGTKNSYYMIDSKTGVTQDIKITCPPKDPQLGVISDQQVILLAKGNKVCSYNKANDLISWVCDDLVGDNIRIQAHNMNLVVISDREMRVYNPEKNVILQDFGKITDPSGRYTAIGYK